MYEEAPIVIFDESEGAPDTSGNHRMEVIELKLDIFGESLRINIVAADKPAKLSDIVPLARVLSEKIVSKTEKNVIDNGDVIACGRNCSHCCRYLVPLTVPEAMRLTEEVRSKPQWERRFLIESNLLIARCVLELTPKDSLEKFVHTFLEPDFKLKDLSDWYSRINLPCPFLLNNLCSIYEHRPIACREHIVTGSASNCKVHSMHQQQLVQIPISVLKALDYLTCEFEQTTSEAIILPFALVWYLENSEYFKHTWPASQLVRHFADNLITQNGDNNKQKTELRVKPN